MFYFFQKHKKVVATLIVVATFFAFGPIVFGATELQNAENDRAVLEAQLAQLEAEIAQKEKELQGQKGQSASISRDVTVLTTQIADAKLKIQSKQLTIKKLTTDINKKQGTIITLEDKLQKEQESLAQMLRKTREIDQTPLVYVALGKSSVSEFYRDLDSFSTINRSIRVSLEQVRSVKNETETEKKDLEKKQDKEVDTKVELEQQKKVVEQSEKEKKQLLSISKNKEKEYQKLITDRQAQAAKIRRELFQLAGGGGPIEFGDAADYAMVAQGKTGVRAAFLLAIMYQESSLGANVGSCYLTNTATGAGTNIKTGNAISRVMKPDRDVTPFLSITKALGRDPFNTRVSCPQSIGYGGAMGPGQFIPSTWRMLEDRIASALGSSSADPWQPQDAIMGTAIYMKDTGVVPGSYTSERNSACKYFSGRSCSASSSIAVYGTSVMAKVADIQKKLDLLQNN
jgi:membrane-bound lytic murein transglycosylase B